MIGYVPTGIVCVLNANGPKVPDCPLKLIGPEDVPLIEIVTVSGLLARIEPVVTITPTGGRLTVAVPKAMGAGELRAGLNMGVNLFTANVKFCVASVPTPLCAVIING